MALGFAHKKNTWAYGGLYAGLSMSLVGVLGLFYLHKKNKQKKTFFLLIKTLKPFNSSLPWSKLPFQKVEDYGSSFFLEKPLPKALQDVVLKGSWTLYKLEKPVGFLFLARVGKKYLYKT